MTSNANKGITLIALVITIIVLLILAGVSISMISGEDGIISKASSAAEQTKEKSTAEEEKLKEAEDYITEKVNQANGGTQNVPIQDACGLYFNEKYSAMMDGVKVTAIFNKDTSAQLYLDGKLDSDIPAGLIQYGDFIVDMTNIDFGTGTISSDGKQINIDGLILQLEENTLLYLRINSTNDGFVICESMPNDVQETDICICGDYIYMYSNDNGSGYDGWNVELFTESHKTMLAQYGVQIPNTIIPTNKNQVTYGPILNSINNNSVTYFYDLFKDCTALVTAPVIPNGAEFISQMFMNCTSLTTAPAIPSSVIDMSSAFYGCTALITAPDMTQASNVENMTCAFWECKSLITAPNLSNCTKLTNMGSTFQNCTSLTTAPIIPNNVTNLNSTFWQCTSLTDVSNMIIPSSVTNMNATFGGCTALTKAPNMKNATNVNSLRETFKNCSKLEDFNGMIISSTVTTMQSTFHGCNSLKGTITINANPEFVIWSFQGVDMSKITIAGTSTKKQEMANTGNNSEQVTIIN